nr:hypothetical protein KPHV_29920 [Kitasatospora purpeofusca]
MSQSTLIDIINSTVLVVETALEGLLLLAVSAKTVAKPVSEAWRAWRRALSGMAAGDADSGGPGQDDAGAEHCGTQDAGGGAEGREVPTALRPGLPSALPAPDGVRHAGDHPGA